LSYWLIAVIVFIALAPLLQLLPNKRLRRAARLREAAVLAGLTVELRTLPALLARVERGQELLFYALQRPRTGGGPELGTWQRKAGVWESVVTPRQGRPVPAGLEQLPAGVMAFASEPQRIGVFWCEQGEESDVSAIAQLLRAMLA